MADLPLDFPNEREHRRLIAQAINSLAGDVKDVPIEYANEQEHRFIMALALNERLEAADLGQVPLRFGNAKEHRRRMVRRINALLNQDVAPPVGGIVTATSVIAVTSAMGDVPSVVSSVPTGGFFDTGLRRLHCSQLGNPPLDGSSPDFSFTNLQTALDALQAGDVLTVAAETFTGSFTLRNAPGTVANPIWICAEVRGQTFISNLIQSVRNGTQTWQSDGNGIFSISGSRPYIGYDITGDDFLPGYAQVSDINATSIPTTTGANNPSGSINKPQRGFAFSGGRIRLRCEGGVNPTGRQIALTQGFNLTQWQWQASADNCIVDGFVFEGAGDGAAMAIDAGAANPEVRNCVFDYCQFGIRASADNTLIKRCEYLTSGTLNFQLEMLALNGRGDEVFRYNKNYYNAGNILGNGNFADALLEGGLDTASFNGVPAQGVVIEECYMHQCFEGSKAGRHRDATVRRNVFEICLDDAVEMETASSNTFGRFGSTNVHENLFRNCFSPISFQGNFTHTNSHFYRNVVVVDNLDIVRPPFLLKMIFTPGNVNVNVYQNIFINPSRNSDTVQGFGSNHWVWFAFSNSTAERIRNFRNNIVIFENDLDQTFDVNNLPAGRANNAVVSPANNTASGQVQGSNGVFAGTTEASMGLNADYSLQAGSPARGAGAPLPGGLPDTGINNNDAGVFPFGVTPPTNWPREDFRAFDEGLPDRWTSPGV